MRSLIFFALVLILSISTRGIAELPQPLTGIAQNELQASSVSGINEEFTQPFAAKKKKGKKKKKKVRSFCSSSKPKARASCVQFCYRAKCQKIKKKTKKNKKKRKQCKKIRSKFRRIQRASVFPCELPLFPELAVLANVDRTAGAPGDVFHLSGESVLGPTDIVKWVWTASDGRTFEGQEIDLSFTEPGFYIVTLSGGDKKGRTVTDEVALTVFSTGEALSELLSLPSVMGDVNYDNELTLEDILQTAQFASSKKGFTLEERRAADLDFDGEVTFEDADLALEALVQGVKVPSKLLVTSGTPGAVVTLVSPELLSPHGVIEIRVEGSNVVQRPIRALPGYVNFMVPLDFSVPEGVGALPVEIQLLADGGVVSRFPFEVLPAAPIPENTKVELSLFFDKVERLLRLTDSELQLTLADIQSSSSEVSVLSETLQESATALSDSFNQFRGILEAPGGKKLADLVWQLFSANGLESANAKIDAALAFLENGDEDAARALLGDDYVCDVVVPRLCKLKVISAAIAGSNDVVGLGCNLLLIAAGAATVYPGDGPVLDAALLLTWASVCGGVEAALDFAELATSLFGHVDGKLSSKVSNEGQGSDVPVKIEIFLDILGLDDICSVAAEKAEDKITSKLTELTVKKLIKRKLTLSAMAKIAEQLGEKVYEKFIGALSSVTKKVVNSTGLSAALAALSKDICGTIFDGTDLSIDSEKVLKGPAPAVGELTFPGDNSAEYLCPTDPEELSLTEVIGGRVQFEAEKDICGEVKKELFFVQCGGTQVTITIGDNGSLNDDIFEVQIDGRTVLTSGSPVRSTSTRVRLPVGLTVVKMIGRAAPDDVGTYFIRFGGNVLVSGDSKSGSDLTPGVVKTFVLEVKPSSSS